MGRRRRKFDSHNQFAMLKRVLDVRRVAGKGVEIHRLDAPFSALVCGNENGVQSGQRRGWI